VKLCHLEDLKQLEALGWKTEGFIRWQARWMNRMESFTGDEEAPLISVEPTDLQWILEGGWRTYRLSVYDRYLLQVVSYQGSVAGATRYLRVPKDHVRDRLSDIESRLYKQKMEEANDE
jgi:hypothetical protein